MIIEFIATSVKETFHVKKQINWRLSRGLTIFMWIFLMNLMKLVPVELVANRIWCRRPPD